MASIADLLWDKSEETINSPNIALSSVDVDLYPDLANSETVKQLGDIRAVYFEALALKEKEELQDDRFFLERATEFVELSEQVQTSTALLSELSTFLGTFQTDLSAVSGHISELQGRSKTIEGRLASRRAVEHSLHPLLVSIGISPALISTIMDTEVSDSWLPTVLELDAKLGAIRSGPRVESRKTLDAVAEALRIRASQKILAHFISLLKPFSLSIAPSLPDLQTNILIPLKPLFDFVRRHSARQAHEFQKAYVSTIRWYYETGFRRYVRSLEKIRLRCAEKMEEIGIVNASSESSLALLSKIKGSTANQLVEKEPDHSRLDGPPIIMASVANEKEIRPSPEALFRSISLVLADNAETEYAFISAFFGRHSSLPLLPTRASPPPLFSSPNGSNASSPIKGNIGLPVRAVDVEERSMRNSSVDGSEWGGESISQSVPRKDIRGETLRKSVVDGVWKSIMEPAQEYSRNFADGLLDSIPPSPVSLLSMIRLNDSILLELVTEENCPPMESTLIGLKMSLWPVFQKVMSAQAESLRRINGTLPSGGVFSGKGNVKDSAVQIIALRYAALFESIVALSPEEEGNELVFTSLLRLRKELDTLLVHQASLMSDPAKRKAFLEAQFEGLISSLSVCHTPPSSVALADIFNQAGSSSHPNLQSEIAHFREALRN